MSNGELITEEAEPEEISEVCFGECITYFILNLNQLAVKIGRTIGSGESRMAKLQTGSVDELFYIGHLQGNEEPHMHHIFRHNRIRGEWFRLDWFLLSRMAQLNDLDGASQVLLREAAAKIGCNGLGELQISVNPNQRSVRMAMSEKEDTLLFRWLDDRGEVKEIEVSASLESGVVYGMANKIDAVLEILEQQRQQQ